MTRRPWLLLSIPIALLLVSACTTTTGTGTDTTDFRASAGTLAYETGNGLSLIYLFDLDQAPADGEIEVTITGPDGWNADQSLTTTSFFTTAGNKWSWRNLTADAVDGTYTLTTQFDGRNYEEVLEVASDDVLVLPDPQTVLKQHDVVAATWPEVPSAASYYVQLYTDSNGHLPRGTLRAYTTSNSYTFSGLSLTAGTTYYLGVQTMSSDFSESNPKLPAGQFNTSFKAVSFLIDE
ncbi:MAG: hypothetical protein WD314_01220 [Trueperaceae bacterium]